MASKEELIVRIGADLDELKKGLNQAGDETEKFGKKTKKVTDNIVGQMKGLVSSINPVTLSLAGLTGAITLMTSGVIRNQKEQRLWARRLSVSEESFTALSAVAKRFGATTDDVGDAMKDLNERIADANRGQKTYEEALNMIGLKSQELISLPVEEQFIKVADAIGKMSNAGDRNFATAELMADAGFRLLEVFQLGESGIRDMTKEVVKNGEALDKFGLQAMENTSKNLREMNAQWTALSNTIAIKFAGAIDTASKVMDGWNNILKSDSKKEIQDLQDEYDTLLKKFNAWNDSLQKGDAQLGTAGPKQGARGARGRVQIIDNDEFIDTLAKLSILEDKLNSLRETSATGPKSGPENEQSFPFIPEQDVLAKGMDTYKEFLEEKAKLEEETEKMISDFKTQRALEEASILAQAQLKNLNDVEEANKLALELAQQQALEEASLRAQEQLKEINERQALHDELYGIDEKAQKRTEMLWEAGWAGKLKVMGGVLKDMSGLMSGESRKMFEIQKALAVAQALVDIPSSALSSFKAGSAIGGPPLGFAYSAIAVASGLAQLQKIQSASFGGGGGGGGGAGAGAGAIGGGAEEAPEPQNVVDATFNIQGSTFGAEQVRELGNSLNDLVDDGFVLRSVNVQ